VGVMTTSTTITTPGGTTITTTSVGGEERGEGGREGGAEMDTYQTNQSRTESYSLTHFFISCSGTGLMQADPTKSVDAATIMWQKEVEAGFGSMLAKLLSMLREGGMEGGGEGGGGEIAELMRKARELDTKVT